jgi:radical SAM protein (TIGR01212 family)
MELYYTLNSYLKKRFGEKVWKIPVDAGFTCPNIDGTKGYGGCTYCNNNSFVHVESGSIKEQILTRINILKKRKKVNKFIVYFQSYTNTHGDFEFVKEKIESSLVSKDIVGIHIGTRPDALDETKINYLVNLGKKYEIVVEMGLQSSKNSTLEKINRGHTFEEYDFMLQKLHSNNLKVCAHIIFGLPDETKKDMLDTVKYLGKNNIHSIKFHHLHIVKNTQMGKEYIKKPFKLLSENEYIEILSEAISLLPADTVIARLVGDAPDELQIAPNWPNNKNNFFIKLQSHMRENKLYQGKLYCK